MFLSIRVLIVMLALACAVAGFGPGAFALGKHKTAYRQKKNSSPYAYLAPKKQKKPTGYYQSTLTGQVVYGKKKK